MFEEIPLSNFSGTARLFPLPNVVMFPYVIQPLHIFEPRYRQMMADSLADDRLLALVLLKPGWDEDYHLQPPIHSVACLGKIFKEEHLPDGRYNLLLHGVHRVGIVEELSTDKLYRTAQVELLDDYSAATPQEEKKLRDELSQLIPTWFAVQAPALQQIYTLLQSDLPLAALCDIFSFALPLELDFKQNLLEELDVVTRVNKMLSQLREMTPPPPEPRKFPPDFSSN